jgi:hypothetical protein
MRAEYPTDTVREKTMEVIGFHIKTLTRLESLGLLQIHIPTEMQKFELNPIPDDDDLAKQALEAGEARLRELCTVLEEKRLLRFMSENMVTWWDKNRLK